MGREAVVAMSRTHSEYDCILGTQDAGMVRDLPGATGPLQEDVQL